MEWSGVEWSGAEWSGVERSGAELSQVSGASEVKSVEWSGVAWRGVAWRGVAWRGSPRPLGSELCSAPETERLHAAAGTHRSEKRLVESMSIPDFHDELI